MTTRSEDRGVQVEARTLSGAATALGVYVLAIVGANVLTARLGLVSAGWGLQVTAGTYAAGFALLARDFVQRLGGVRLSLLGVGVGVALSWLLADPSIAVASAVAFGTAELVDLVIFTPLRRLHGFLAGALASNVVSAPIDTVVFLWVAGFGVTTGAVGGQFVAKVVWATVVPLVLYLGVRRALLRQPVNPEGA